MKQRHVVYLCLLGSLVIFCLATDIFDNIALFLLFGVVPGRAQPLAPQEMMAFYLSVCGLMLVIPFQKYLLRIERQLNQLTSQSVS